MKSNFSMRTILRYAAIGLGLLLVIMFVVTLIRNPAVKIAIPTNADMVSLRKVGSDGKATGVTVTKNSTKRLALGTYEVTYFKNNKAVALTKATVRIAFSQTITSKVAGASNSFLPIMHQRADMVTPLQDGYLYVDTYNRAVYYADKSGLNDVSDRFELRRTTPQDSTFIGYNTVLGIQQIANGSVVVTTTKAVFVVKGIDDIVRMPASSTTSLDITSSSYDRTSDRLFVLSAHNRQVYYYDLSKTSQGPKDFYKSDLDVNRVSANGGKVGIYYDSVPSLEKDVLKAYALNRQLAPIMLDASSAKVLKKFGNEWQGTTLFALSNDGSYVAIKRKFANTMHLEGLNGGGSYDIVASDTNAVGWQDDNVLLFGLGKSLWKVDPQKTKSDLTLASSANGAVTHLYMSKNEVLAVSNDSNIYKLAALGSQPNSVASSLQKMDLDTPDYTIDYVIVGSQINIAVETRPNYNNGFDDAALQASMDNQYQKTVASLGAITEQPNVHLQQIQMLVDTPYLALGDSGDRYSQGAAQ